MGGWVRSVLVPNVKGESHSKLEVSVAVSIVKSRQVSEVKKKKFSKATSVSGGGKGETRHLSPFFFFATSRVSVTANQFGGHRPRRTLQ